MSARSLDTVRGLRQAMMQAGPACTTADVELFTSPDAFDDEPDTGRQIRESTAKTICGTCPARPACLDYALAIRPRDGVWAGFTAEEITGLAYGISGFERVGVTGEVA